MNAFKNHLHSYTDLKTPYAQTRAGFVSIALERNERASPHIAEAKDLKVKAAAAKKPIELLEIPDIFRGLLTAAGISDKAAGHIDREGHLDAVRGLIEKYLEPAGSLFVEELVYRFLLTRGDTLGGSMRNVVGALAQRKFTRALVANLNVAGKGYFWLQADTGRWVASNGSDPKDAEFAKGLSWQQGSKHRTLMYNIKVPFVGARGNGVDMCLFNCAHNTYSASLVSNPASYLSLGELKGGIDPAGADEHWKTANSALTRIREKFSERGLRPPLFFVGAAIEESMAQEIWNQLDSGSLANAANLTSDIHLSSLCSWLSNI